MYQSTVVSNVGKVTQLFYISNLLQDYFLMKGKLTHFFLNRSLPTSITFSFFCICYSFHLIY